MLRGKKGAKAEARAEGGAEPLRTNHSTKQRLIKDPKERKARRLTSSRLGRPTRSAPDKGSVRVAALAA
ncbi:hypothetical protein FACS189472_07630 [Alphaproteobacteria bacterium]|nr:hypothetical protein FACS189472_07630 [Alphaproteobacteria bacterium]